MKIRGNLLNGARPLPARPVAMGVWLLAATLGSAALWLFADTTRRDDQRIDLDARLADLQDQQTDVAGMADVPSGPELQAMKARVQTLNSLAGVHGLDTPELLLWLEQHLPREARVTNLHHKARAGETYLIAEASSPEPLTQFLREMEKEPRFSEVLLAKQGTRSVQGRTGAIQFEIRIQHKK